MIIQKLPYILFRSYPDFGYLTDNRNFGYDTASHSCIKVGELLISEVGKVFYSALKSRPQNVENVIQSLCIMFPEIPSQEIVDDAWEFYSLLSAKGFIYLGEEVDYVKTVERYFSYGNTSSFWLDIPQLQEGNTIYEDTFGKDFHLAHVHLSVSGLCNERCVHCYIPNQDKTGTMSEILFERIIKQCSQMNVLNITISGGEPMLNPHLNNFLKECGRYNFSVNLLSNLTLLTDELLETIASNPLISVQTSLYAMDESVHDAITRNRGSFVKTMRSIILLRERDVPLQINCPIMRQNVDCFSSVLDFAKLLNIEADSDYSLFGTYDGTCRNLSCRLSVDEISRIAKPKEPVSSIEPVSRKNSSNSICPVCKSSLCISCYGDIYPCEGWQSLKLGHIDQEYTLYDIWTSNPDVLHLRNLAYKDFPKCDSCHDKEFCTPCLVMNANENSGGNYYKINPFICDIARIKAQNHNHNQKQ